ncbi:MAG TPA: glycosyltransferase family 2 protein [Ktedonobacteraceae bacterium]|nr:glycosyltransferase family 2 protein [Ktedonobacteraceae bacterium]
MKTRRIVIGKRKRSLSKVFLPGILTITALVAFWQSYRTRKSIREARKPEAVPLPEMPPRVSIIVPMRNEAAHLDTCLASLCAQDYPNFEIIVIDDASSDATPQLLARWIKRDPRVRAYRVNHLPDGWAGKTHAMHTGVMLTDGEWLLFTDADTCHSPQALRIMMGHALDNQVDMLSLMPNVMTLGGPIMPLLWPITAILLASRLTPAEVRDPASSRAFGFGQYTLLRRKSYLASGGYDAPGMRATAVDDLALAVHIKRAGWQIELVNGRGLLTNLQWTTWQSARQGWVKSSYSEVIRANLSLATLPSALAFFAYGLVPAVWLLYALSTGKLRRLSTLLAVLTVLTQIDTKRQIDRDHDLALPWSLAAPLGWTISGVMLLDVTRLLMSGRRASWKGRMIPEQERALHPARKRKAVPPRSLAKRTIPTQEGKIPSVAEAVCERS